MQEFVDSQLKKGYIWSSVTNFPDPIKKFYTMYLEKEDTPRIVKVTVDKLYFDLDRENGLAYLYLKL